MGALKRGQVVKNRDVLAVFNRGRISQLALARTDVARVALSADVQTNWVPRTLGAMSLRPGLKYNGPFQGDGALLPFVFSTNDIAALELTPDEMRVWDNGDTLVSRPSVSTTITNGNFATDISGWTVADESGAASTWSVQALKLLGTGTNSAKMRQEVTVSGSDEGVLHALRVTVGRGPVLLRVGTTAGADDVFPQAVLRTGSHSIAFTPASSFWVELSSPLSYPVLVGDINIESAGVLSLPTIWDTTDACKAVRWHQSADVVFCASGKKQQRIERRLNNSWSVVDYESDNGPYLTENTENITLTPSGLTGVITLTASRPIFQAEHVDAIFKMSSQGQTVASNLTSELTYTDAIRVTGVTTSRVFQVSRGGTWAGTLTLQRSIGAPGTWEDIETYTANGTSSYDDGLDNSIVYYRLGFNSGDFTSGTAEASLAYEVGSITGVVRVSGFTSETEVNAVVLSALGATEATDIWAEGAWSDKNGWPTAVSEDGGRLNWHGNGRNYLSVSDAFSNFDPDFEGDAGPINRSIGPGVVSSANWALGLQRLIVGTDGGEYAVRSNSFDEPITPSNYNVKAPTTKGSASAPAVSADGRGYFINRTKKKVYELEYDAAVYDFSALDMTVLVPEIGEVGFERLAIQMLPDMRLHAVRSDGTVGMLVRDAAEDVLCWLDIETDGEVEDAIVLPGTTHDRVIYRVKRTINGSTARYNEEWACETTCVGGDVNQQADSHIVGVGAISGLDHLEGEEVVIWADGADRGTATVSGGSVAQTYDNWCVGLGYSARYKSAKLAGQTALGLSLTQRSRINAIGLVLADTHYQGLQYGPSFDVMDDLPQVEAGEVVDMNTVWDAYDRDMVEFPGEWSTDNRLCLTASAPRPCTVSAAVLNIDRQDKD